MGAVANATTHQRYSYLHNIIGNSLSLLSVNGNDNRILLGSVDGNSLSLSPGAPGESAAYFLGPQTSSVPDPRIRHCQWANMAYLLPGRRLWVPAPNRIRLLLTAKKNSINHCTHIYCTHTIDTYLLTIVHINPASSKQAEIAQAFDWLLCTKLYCASCTAQLVLYNLHWRLHFKSSGIPRLIVLKDPTVFEMRRNRIWPILETYRDL